MATQLAAHIYTSSSFQVIWERALTEYAENLPPEEKENVNLLDPKWQQIRSVGELVSDLENRHRVFDEDTGRGTYSSTALSCSLKGIQALVNMFGGAAGAVFPPSSQILGAVSVVLHAGIKVSDAFDQVSSLFTRISVIMNELQVLTQVTLEAELETSVANILVCTLRICGMATRKAYHDETIETIKEGHTLRRVWRKTKQKAKSKGSEYVRELLLGTDPDIDAAVSQLKEAVEAEQKMIAALTKKDVTEIKAVSIHIDLLSREICDAAIGVSQSVIELRDCVEAGQRRASNAFADVKVGLEKADKKQDCLTRNMDEVLSLLKNGPQAVTRETATQASKSVKALIKLRETLNPVETAYQSLLDNTKKDRAKGTCDWILQEPLVSDWLRRDSTQSPVLIISGATGSGKTFLAARIIEELQKRFISPGQGRPTSLAYFFCRKNLTELSSVNKVLRTLAYQISELDSHYTTYIGAKDRLDKIQRPESVSKLWNTLFVDYYKTVTDNSTVLVIDGIDECLKHDKETFQDFVDALQNCLQGTTWTLPNVRILLLVQLENGKKIEEVFGGSAAYFTITEAHTMGDLDAFVKDKLVREWKNNVIAPNLREHVHKTVKVHCKADFLRTSLLLEEVTSLSREDDIWALISRPPKSVEEATMLVLRRLKRGLDNHGLEDLVDILAWVAKSHEPLSLATLDAILTIRSQESSRLINLRELLTQKYSALFVVSNYDDFNDIQSESAVRRRLGLDEPAALAAMDPSSVLYYQAQLASQYGAHTIIDLPHEILKQMSYTGVRLADSIIDQLDVVTKSLTEDDIAYKTLWGCLKAMCDPLDTFDKDAAIQANQYCASNVMKHLMDVPVEALDAKMTREIVRLLVKILRDESIIDRWLDIAAWETTSELLISDDVEKKLVTWFQSEDIQGRLPQSDLDWIDRAKNSPTECLFHGVALGHARQWLCREDSQALGANFRFIGTYRSKLDSAQSSSSDDGAEKNRCGTSKGSDVNAENVETDANLHDLTSSSTEEICAHARWAQFPVNALWYQRLGSALHQAGMYDEALVQYQKSLDADPLSPMTHHCMGMTYWNLSDERTNDAQQASDRKEAISYFVSAIDKYKQRIGEKKPATHAASKDQDGYRHSMYLLAILYESVGETSQAEIVLRNLVSDWGAQVFDRDEIDYTAGSTSNSYLDVLIESGKNDEATVFLESLIKHPQASDPSYYAMYFWRIYSSDNLLKLAYRTKRFDILDKFWQQATFVVAVRGSAGELAEVRYRHACAMARLSPERRDYACHLLRMISNDQEADHYIVDQAEKELGRIYLDLALEARDIDDWSGVAKYFQRLDSLTHEDDYPLNYKKNESTLFSASWYQLHRRSGKAKDAVRAQCQSQFAFLYDDQPDNDQQAWYQIANLTLAVGDRERAMAVTNMLGSISAYDNKTNIISQTDLADTNHSEQQTPVHDSLTSIQRSQETDDRAQSTAAEDVAGSALVTSQAVNDHAPALDTASEPRSTDDSQTIEADGQKAEVKKRMSRYYRCDGPCSRFEDIASHEIFYRCTICSQNFCEECYQKVKYSAMSGFKVCGSSHDWISMPSVEKCPDGCILVRGKAVPILDWLDQFADAYGIPRWSHGGQIASNTSMIASPA